MIKNKLFVTAFIADIHFGANKADDLYGQLCEYFLHKLEKYPTDMIVFGGDTFHNVITMNYSTSHIVLLFMENVIDLCKRKGIKYIRVIQGTVSHDNNQLHNFHMFEARDDVNFKIIMTAEEETLPEGLRILYLPEEYMENQEEYYGRFFDNEKKTYDFIFGHGMVEEVSFTGRNQESENTMSKAPVFRTKKLINLCRGPILFGHIHIHTIVKKHLYYPGSFTRWKFGEEEDKGWYLSIYNIEDGTYAMKFIKNKLAPVYTTVEVTLTDEYNEHPEKLIKNLEDVKGDKIKIKLQVGKDPSSYALQYLAGALKDNGNIKLEVTNSDTAEEELSEEDLELDEEMEKLGFVFEKGMELPELLQKFIKVKWDKDVPIEVINEELEPLKEKVM